MWIGVDLTKPEVRLINAELGQGSALGEIAITWEARDTLLARQPVSLSYAEYRDGPWTTIAAGLENTGRYAWRYDSQTPERLYLRLEVRDEAGNIGVSESIEPLSLERTNPAVRLRSVRPVHEGSPQSRARPPASRFTDGGSSTRTTSNNACPSKSKRCRVKDRFFARDDRAAADRAPFTRFDVVEPAVKIDSINNSDSFDNTAPRSPCGQSDRTQYAPLDGLDHADQRKSEHDDESVFAAERGDDSTVGGFDCI